jgi:hypothetical protein
MHHLPRPPARDAGCLLLLAAAACGERSPVSTPPGEGPSAPLRVATLACTARVEPAAVACRPASPEAPGSANVVVGGQGVYVTLTSSGAAFDAGTRVFRADVAVQNLIGQAIGTTDGATAAPYGVRVFFAAPPSGGVTVRDVDGTGTFTTSNQPYFRYGQLLAPSETSVPRTWRWDVPVGVTAFTFQVAVSAPVRWESGWIDVSPADATLPPGGTRQLAAVVRDALGRPMEGRTVTWGTTNAAAVTVSAAGVATGVAGGAATVTAQDGPRAGQASLSTTAGVVTPGAPGAAAVTFAVDAGRQFAISPFIYGVNFYENTNAAFEWQGFPMPAGLTLSRAGGNRWTAYNWENNASNAGRDWFYSNDGFLSSSTVPGEAVRARVQGAFDRGAGMIVTVPMLGHVSRDRAGSMGTDAAGLATRLATRFRASQPAKGAAFTLTPDTADANVYQDEFVWWLNRLFPAARHDPAKPIFYSLDNEPDIWHDTHEEIRSDVGGSPNYTTYTELLDRSVATSKAVKDVVPGAKVFGPVTATWTGATTLGRWPHPDPVAGTADFLDWYLDRMRTASQADGRRLLDVLDIHWYSEVHANGTRILDDWATQTDAVVQARVQAPRSLWDPTYTETSWVIDVTGGPVRLIPRLRDKIAAHYPGTGIAITEYFYGGGGHVSGGVAQADVLGIFGREGVFAATLWPLSNLDAYGGNAELAYRYVRGAFAMYRNYDGAGGRFGDVGLQATTTNVAGTSVYASQHTSDANRVVLIAINKTNAPMTAGITVRHPATFASAEVYTLTAASGSPVRGADLAPSATNAFLYTMPAMSVTTLVLRV